MKHSRFIITLGVLFLWPGFVLPAFSQQTWTRTYGGPNDVGESVQQTTDGGYIVTGYSSYPGSGGYQYYPDYQARLIKINAFGDVLWSKTFGYTGFIQGYSVRQTLDGGYIIAGLKAPIWRGYDNPYFDVYLIKTNPSGDTLWTRTYGRTWGRNSIFSVQQTSDGGYIVTGERTFFGDDSFVYLIKTNPSGDTLWTRTYGVGSWGNSVQQTSDGGYIIAGGTYFGRGDILYLIKTNVSGDTLWTRTYSDTSADSLYYYDGYCVQQTSDGGYIVTGGITIGGYKAFLTKLNASGDTLWTKEYGGFSGGNSVKQTTDGGYIMVGLNYFNNGNRYDVYLVKTDSLGDSLWTRTYGGGGDDCGNSVQQTSDGGFIIAGSTNSFGNGTQIYLIKTNANGNVGVEDQGRSKLKVESLKYTITPNPFTSFATIKGHEQEGFLVYDVAGRKVGAFKGDRVGEGLAAGVYFLRPAERSSKPLRIVKLR